MIFVNLQFLVKCSIRRFWPNHNHPWAKHVGKSGRQRGATPTTRGRRSLSHSVKHFKTS